MQLNINGQSKDFSGSSLQVLIKEFCPQKRNIVVELNGTIIAQDQWEATQLKEGDQIELVSFVGGG